MFIYLHRITSTSLLTGGQWKTKAFDILQKLTNDTVWMLLRERLRTHKVFTLDQCFCLNYHKFSIKSYVLDVY